MNSFFGNPRSALHEFCPFKISTLRNSFNSSESLLEEFVLLCESSPLPLSLVVSKHVFDSISVMIGLGFASIKAARHLALGEALFEKSIFKRLLELHNLNVVFVSDSSDFLQMGVLQNVVHLPEKVIDDHHTLLSPTSDLQNPCSELLDQREYLGWNALVRNVHLVLPLRLSHVWRRLMGVA